MDELERIDLISVSGQKLRRCIALKAAYVEETKRRAESVPYLAGLGQGSTFEAW